ncbi:MAG: metalloregulator ArsR/SmtB family transcription factor [Acidobacteria bacterium]|nr:metalloregulator ArsR/SmtB family transcription factor [Acidobacteriota bacterium]
MDVNGLAYMESFFMALADKTRLRLLNLIRNEEVCVCFFTEVLGDSQPKISRHLAYLRNAGIVKARRDGKWMHYSIVAPESDGGRRVLAEILDWLDDQPEMKAEREKYRTVCCTPEMLVQIARTPIPFALPYLDDEIEVAEPEYEYAGTGHNEIDEFLL